MKRITQGDSKICERYRIHSNYFLEIKSLKLPDLIGEDNQSVMFLIENKQVNKRT